MTDILVTRHQICKDMTKGVTPTCLVCDPLRKLDVKPLRWFTVGQIIQYFKKSNKKVGIQGICVYSLRDIIFLDLESTSGERCFQNIAICFLNNLLAVFIFDLWHYVLNFQFKQYS